MSLNKDSSAIAYGGANELVNMHQLNNGVKPSYSNTLSQATKELSVYNELILQGIQEKLALKGRIQSLKHEIGRVEKVNFEQRAVIAELRRRTLLVNNEQERREDDIILREKQAKETRKELLSANILKQQTELCRGEVLKRLDEEKQLIVPLQEIIRKMNKKIADITQERDDTRAIVQIQGKTLAQLRVKVYKMRNQVEHFYDRATASLLLKKRV